MVKNYLERKKFQKQPPLVFYEKLLKKLKNLWPNLLIKPLKEFISTFLVDLLTTSENLFTRMFFSFIRSQPGFF